MSTRMMTVAAKLREGLVAGAYSGGQRMNEVELASEYGVSRTPVRAALSALAADGLLVYQPNAGYVVRNCTAESMMGVFEARAVLEGLAARQAGERGLSSEQAARMSRVLRDTEAALKRGRAPGELRRFWSTLNRDFHGTIVEASGNAHLDWLLGKSRDVPMLQAPAFRAIDLARVAKAHDDHVAIFDALVQGQAARAEDLAREHIYRAGVFVAGRMRLAEGRRKGKQAADLAS